MSVQRSRRPWHPLTVPLFYCLAAVSSPTFGFNIGEQRVVAAYGHLPLAFEPNWGQTHEPAAFLARCRNYTVFLEPDNLKFALYSRPNPGDPARAQFVTIRFVGAKRNLSMQGQETLPGHSNYIVGQDPRRWHTNIPQYQRVTASELYPGVALSIYSKSQIMEYDFLLSPGADFAGIRLNIEGAQQTSLNDSGDLVLQMRAGQLVQTPAASISGEGRRPSLGGCELSYPRRWVNWAGFRHVR